MIGSIVSIGGVPTVEVAFAFLAAALISGAGNAVNDYADRELDATNSPERPIPSGRISPSRALLVGKVLFVAGVLSAALTMRISCVALAVVNSVLLAYYASSLKRMGLLGNLSIGYLVGSTFFFGGLAVGGFETVALLAVMAGLSTAGRELIKDIEDVEGDRESGSESFPISFGEKKASYLAAAFTGAAIAITPFPYLLGLFGNFYLPPLTVSVVAFLAGIAVILRGPGKESAAKSSLLYKVGMTMGLVAFLSGALF